MAAKKFLIKSNLIDVRSLNKDKARISTAVQDSYRKERISSVNKTSSDIILSQEMTIYPSDPLLLTFANNLNVKVIGDINNSVTIPAGAKVRLEGSIITFLEPTRILGNSIRYCSNPSKTIRFSKAPALASAGLKCAFSTRKTVEYLSSDTQKILDEDLNILPNGKVL